MFGYALVYAVLAILLAAMVYVVGMPWSFRRTGERRKKS